MKLNAKNNAIPCTVCIFKEEEEEEEEEEEGEEEMTMMMMIITLFTFFDTVESSMMACFAIDTKIFTPVQCYCEQY